MSFIDKIKELTEHPGKLEREKRIADKKQGICDEIEKAATIGCREAFFWSNAEFDYAAWLTDLGFVISDLDGSSGHCTTFKATW